MRKWTKEQKQRQAMLIKLWKPWKSSTGAKTLEGKEISKMNAYKFGAYSKPIKDLRKQLNQGFVSIDDYLSNT